MKRSGRQLFCVWIAALGGALPCLAQQPGDLFVAQPGQIQKLVDSNGDGDFFDFGEVTTFATGLPSNLGAMVGQPGRLFVVDTVGGNILLLRDLNGDGDAFDFGEVTTYATLPGVPAAGLTLLADGTLLVFDTTNKVLYATRDLNGDGDALDFGELTIVASGFAGPLAISSRPDGSVLVLDNASAMPVRILTDRTGDGTFLDFAENISYAENFSPGNGLYAMDNWTSFMARASDGVIVKLQDLTQDGDALDFGEVINYAEGLSSAIALTGDGGGTGGLYVAANDVPGTLYWVRDLNGDGDALDFDEVTIVATGLTQPDGLTRIAVPTTGCIAGDANSDGSITTADIVPFANALITGIAPEDLCRFDTNHDGLFNGRDIQPFVRLLVP